MFQSCAECRSRHQFGPEINSMIIIFSLFVVLGHVWNQRVHHNTVLSLKKLLAANGLLAQFQNIDRYILISRTVKNYTIRSCESFTQIRRFSSTFWAGKWGSFVVVFVCLFVFLCLRMPIRSNRVRYKDSVVLNFAWLFLYSRHQTLVQLQ